MNDTEKRVIEVLKFKSIKAERLPGLLGRDVGELSELEGLSA